MIMSNLPKFLVRVTILFVAAYFLFTYILAQNGIEYFNDFLCCIVGIMLVRVLFCTR